MRYQVPQFIDVEDKIFGPLTMKQFVYIAGGVGLSFAFWRFLPLIIAILFIIPVVTFSVALAFYRPNNRPLINTLEYAFNYLLHNKLYLWKAKDPIKIAREKQADTKTASVIRVPKLSESKLKDLAWSLDIKENLTPVTPPQQDTYGN